MPCRAPFAAFDAPTCGDTRSLFTGHGVTTLLKRLFGPAPRRQNATDAAAGPRVAERERAPDPDGPLDGMVRVTGREHLFVPGDLGRLELLQGDHLRTGGGQGARGAGRVRVLVVDVVGDDRQVATNVGLVE